MWILVHGWKMEKVDTNRRVVGLPETEMWILIHGRKMEKGRY